jgi:hypothetical protein
MLNTPQVRKFVLHCFKKGFITRKSSDIFGFYMMCSYLRNNEMVYNDGMTSENKGEKIWKLTPKGVELAKKFQQLENIEKDIKELER